MAAGISSVVTLCTFIGLPVSILLAGVSVSDVAMALTKKYQKKLAKVTKLVDIVTSALIMFETSISKVLKDGRVNEQELDMLQTFHFRVLNKLVNVDDKMEADTRTQLKKKSTGRDQGPKEGCKEEQCLMTCTLFPLCYLMCYNSAKNG